MSTTQVDMCPIVTDDDIPEISIDTPCSLTTCTLIFQNTFPLQITCTMNQIVHHTMKYALLDHTHVSVEAAARVVLYRETSVISGFIPIDQMNRTVVELRNYVSLSSIIICSLGVPKDNLTDDTPLIWFFVEFTPSQDAILLDGYQLSYRDYQTKVRDYEQSLLYPISCVPSNPPVKKRCVLLDIDNTIIISNDDCMKKYQSMVGFRSDYHVHGLMAITGEPYNHRIHMRDGLYEFLRRLKKVANVFFITWGDLHYARSIISQGNTRNWKNTTESHHDDDEDVTIPLLHVFSSRCEVKKGIRKHFRKVLPFVDTSMDTEYEAVDDDIMAWDPLVRNKVIQIIPLRPVSSTEKELLDVVTMIEELHR